MEMSKIQIVPAPPDRVWEALNDPELLQACITGCEATERIADNEYKIAMKVKVGPVNARFSGKITLVDLNPPESYTLNFEGQGGMAGFAKGVARVALSSEGEATALAYSASAQIGGKLAQIGSRLIDGAAHKMAADFFAALARELEAAPEAAVTQDDSLKADAQDASAAPEDKPPADAAEAAVPAPQVGPAPAPGPQLPPEAKPVHEETNMVGDAKGFRVWNVQMQEIPSEARAHDGTDETDQKAVMSASVECLKCGNTWTATEGAEEKSMTNVLGGIVISCPKCKQTEGVQRPDFQ